MKLEPIQQANINEDFKNGRIAKEAQVIDTEAPVNDNLHTSPLMANHTSQLENGSLPPNRNILDDGLGRKESMITDSISERVKIGMKSADLTSSISIEDLHIAPSNARKRDVPSTSWSDEPNQAFRQKLTVEPEDERNEGESKLEPSHIFNDIDNIKLTQMQLSDRQGSHSRASSSAQSLPLAFTRGLLASNGPNSGKQFSRPFQSAQNSPLGSHSHKRAHVPFSVSEPSDSPLKRRLMRESGSDGNLKGLPVRAELLKKPNADVSDSSEASRDLDADSHESSSLASPHSQSSERQLNGHISQIYALDPDTEKQVAHAKLLIGRQKFKEAFKLLQEISLKYDGHPDILCQTGICYYLEGNHAQAFACFMSALEGNPSHIPSMLACGAFYKVCDLLQDSVLILRKAHKVDPENQDVSKELVAALSDLGTKLKSAGNSETALELYMEAKMVGANNAQILYNIGVLYSEQGEHEKALDYFEQTVKHHPGLAEAHCNMGVIYKNRGENERAIQHYRNALNASPNFQIVRTNLAIALTELATTLKNKGEIEKSINLYEEALVYHPKCAEALYNLAVVYGEDQNISKAMFMYEMCLLVKPDCAEAHNNLGVFYRTMGNLERAYQCYMNALQINPKFHQALSNVAVIFTSQGKAQEAHQLFVAAIASCPNYAEAYNNLGVLQRDVGQVQFAIDSYEKCLKLDPANQNAGQNRLLALNYIHHGETEFVCSEHRAWGLEFQERHPRLPEVSLSDRSPDKNLTIGYISPDLFTHSVSYFAEAPLTHHTERVNLIVYNCTSHTDSKTERLKREVEKRSGSWVEAAQIDDKKLAQKIRDDEVDILVELTGHTANNRLAVMAMKPAPIQVTWIGYPNSTGLEAVDYRITDFISDPTDTEQTYVEELIRFSPCFLCYTPSQDVPEVSPAPCRELGFVTFGSFNALSKITGEVLKVWAKILAAVPNSRLVLKNKPFACPHARQYFQQQFTQEGIHSSRIDLLPLTSGNKDHLVTYSMMDISLDPWPYAGTTTTCESLFMGVPVVSLRGKCHAHNVGATLLACINMEKDWLANSINEYISLAISAAQNFEKLSEVRRSLRELVLASPLCDAPNFVANLEDEYHRIWQKYAELT